MATEFLYKTETGIEVYQLTAGNLSAKICTFGGRLMSLFVPDKNGGRIDVLAGFDDPEEYRDDHGTYFGAIVGRVCNRIGGAKFELDGKQYELYANDNGVNHLHGGKQGFDSKLWRASIPSEKDSQLVLSYFSPDGEEGYPGNLSVRVVYTLTEDGILIDYAALSDSNTICSLTNHSYFNLDGSENILSHTLMIAADQITPIDQLLIPHGERSDVQNTPFDFTTPKKIGQDIFEKHPLLEIAKGYDFNYVLRAHGIATPVATASSDVSGITMSVFTDRPCIQLYTGNFLDGFFGKRQYPVHSSFCLETQGYPNACNVPEFESCKLNAGQLYSSRTEYRFGLIQ